MKELEELKKILTNDEEVKECFKPSKKRFVAANIISTLLFLIIFFGGIFTVGILGIVNIIHFRNENGTQDLLAPIMFLVFSTPFLIMIILSIVGYIVRYQRTIYVVTNKRLIIRSGFIGVDYKSIELKYVGLVNVRVDFLDKICGSTGTITFASPAMPMMNTQNNVNGAFAFRCVENPYEVYKKVKEYIPENGQ